MFACKVGLSVPVCRGMSSIVAVAFSEVHGLLYVALYDLVALPGMSGLRQGRKALPENEGKFRAPREELRGGPVESARLGSSGISRCSWEMPWLHRPLLSKGWRARPTVTASETSFFGFLLNALGLSFT